MMLRWENQTGSGTYRRCLSPDCLRAEGHTGRHRFPLHYPLRPLGPALGPGRCPTCGAEVWYKRSRAGWRPAWRNKDGRVHRC